MNCNELNLHEITITLEMYNKKEKLTKEEEEFIKFLEKKRDNLLNGII